MAHRPRTVPETSSSPRLPRRTLLRGAAWTAPAVTVAVAAPAIAASPADCPTLPDPDGWDTEVPYGGTLDPETESSTTSWQSLDGADTWVSQRNSTSSTTAGTTVRTMTEFPVLAGITYTVSFEAAGQWSAESADPAAAEDAGQGLRFRLQIPGEVLAQSTVATRTAEFPGSEALPMSEGDPVWQTYFVMITPMADQTVTLEMLNLLRQSSDGFSDDVLVRMPVITCSV